MPTVGFHAGHEQFAPSELLKFVRLAESAGFGAGMCSDHFHPWGERQGQSGFAWSWLGAALQATSLSFGVVCAPGQRYHPAIIAQAAATLAEMFPGRFWLAIGSGESLNEHITGEPWPVKAERNARLRECAEVMRALWRGETVDHAGRIRVREAKLYTLPKTPPLLLGAAISAETAEWMGSWTDGLITVGSQTEGLQKNVDAFHRGGGRGKRLILQSAICYGPTDEEALQDAWDQARQMALQPRLLANLAMPADFDAATQCVRPEDLAEKLRVSSDLKQHRDWIEADLELGFDEIYLNHVGRDVPRFIEAFGDDVLPGLGKPGA